MGYIEKRGKSSWRICSQIQTPSGPQPVRYTLRMDPALPESVQRREAERELRNLEKRLDGSAPASYTLREWSREWIRQLSQDASPVTLSNYQFLLDSRILPTLGDLPLADLTPAILTDWMMSVRSSSRKTTRKSDADLSRPRREAEQRALRPPSKLKKPLSAKTILHYYACLDTCLAAAVRLGHLDHNPMARVQRPRQAKKHPPVLSEADALALISMLDDLPREDRCFRLAVLLALSCGLRLGEVGGLLYSDIDWTRSTISISRAVKYTPATGTITGSPKSAAAARRIALPPALVTLLRDSWDQDQEDLADAAISAEATGKPCPYQDLGLIIHGRNGRALNKDSPSKWFRRFADRNGFPGITFHDLRHAHASILMAHNMDAAAVAARMGHTDASVTLANYVHPFRDRDVAAAGILDALLQPQAPDPGPDPAGTDPASGSAPDPDPAP